MATENSIRSKMTKPCRGCIHKCLAAHPPPSSNKFSFFKLMVGDFYSFLEIPLECSNQLHSEASKDAILEGPSGHLWHVILCCNGASPCFKDGWEKFVSDNSIEVEDIIVFRHVINSHFVVQIFGSNGYEKQGASSVEHHRFRQVENGDPSTICTPRRCELKKENIELSGCLENSYVGRRRNQGAVIKRVDTNPKEILSGGGIEEVENLLVRSVPSKRKKAHIVQPSYAETCISNDKSVAFDNHIICNPSKTNNIDATMLTRAKFSISRNAVGLSAEQPIILDGEEEIDTRASSAYKYVPATVAACGHSALEVLQRKLSPCTAAAAPMKPEDGFQLRSSKRVIQRNSCVQKAEEKFSLVLCKSAVFPRCYLTLPAHFCRDHFKHKDVVFLLAQKDEWQVAFQIHGRSCGLTDGWKKFVRDNKLKKGDTCIFELVNRRKHVFKVDILKADKKGTRPEREEVQEE